jgi:hypothetical protein
MLKRLLTRIVAAGKLKNVVTGRLSKSEIANEVNEAEEPAVEATVGVVDVVIEEASIVVEGTLIDVGPEGQDLPLLDVETRETEDHFVLLHRQEISILMFQVVAEVGEEMTPAAGHLQAHCLRQFHLLGHPHLLHVADVRSRNHSHHIHDEEVPLLTEIAEYTVAEAVEEEDGGVQIVAIIEDLIRPQISQDLGLP